MKVKVSVDTTDQTSAVYMDAPSVTSIKDSEKTISVLNLSLLLAAIN